MIGALWTGISGLSSQQQALDNESNNIANVNTVGFKSSRISFADQMYQDSIGKGSKVLDAEKLYTQGNLKLTGVSYDMALSGSGFFTVSDTSASGTSENFYTRAGNFRMGDNGALQDAAGNEVQGWPMQAIDADNDVTSTNPNVSNFTNDYTKLLSSKIISHSTYVETITAKATDYSATAESDSESVFSGAGLKTKSAKISDVEAAISNYTSWLQKLKETPDGASATSIAQVSEVNFKSGSESIISKEGDQIYVYIDGNKISQNYISATADADFISDFDTNASTYSAQTAASVTNTISPVVTVGDAEGIVYTMTVDGISFSHTGTATDTESTIATSLGAAAVLAGFPTGDVSTAAGALTIANLSSGLSATEMSYDSAIVTNFDQLASKIETYKALADKISETSGIVAYMVEESGGTNNDSLEATDTYTLNTKNEHMYKGIMQIKSLIPGEEFVISEVGEISGGITAQGSSQTSVTASAGSGTGALETSRDALAKLITGKQQDVYGATNLNLDPVNGNAYTLSFTIFDEETGGTIPIPHNGATIPVANPVLLETDGTIDDFVTKFNAGMTLSSNGLTAGDPLLTDYLEAVNINDSLVIRTKDANYEVDFSTTLKEVTVNNTGTALAPVLDITNEIPLEKSNDLSGRAGAGAEFIEMVNTINQTSSQGSLQLRLDTLGISDSAFGEFAVDSSGLITMTQDGAEIAIGQASIALFNNNIGLEAYGDNLLKKTTDSGEPIYNLNNDKTGNVEGQTLELSTADLSESLVNLMVFQRAFEANAKSITTADEILTTLIGLKR